MARGVARFFRTICPSKGWLEFYARQFRTTEFNGVFCRTPTAEAIRGWEETDARRLHICLEGLQIHDTSRNSLALLEDRLGPLGKKSRPGSVSTSFTI